MKRIKALVIALACGAALTVSAAAYTFSPQNTNQSSGACCDMENCCKSGAMSCCKKKTKRGKNAHACCKAGNGASCCCTGDSCTMPNKKPSNTNTN